MYSVHPNDMQSDFRSTAQLDKWCGRRDFYENDSDINFFL